MTASPRKMRALEKANWVRVQRGELRRALKEGRVDPWALLCGSVSEWEMVVREMKVSEVLIRIPGVGRATRDDALEELDLSMVVTMEGLTYQRRAELAAFLEGVLAGEPVEAPAPATAE